MLCERAQELFSDYHEGAVKSAMLVPFEGHLEQCEECRSRMEGLREVWTVLDRAPVVSPPPDFRAAVWARIDAMEAEKARKQRPLFAFDWRALFRPATLGWSAAVLAVVLLAPVVIPGTRQQASLFFPWSLFISAPAAAHITVSEPRLDAPQSGQTWIVVPISNGGKAAVDVEVVVNDGAAPTPVRVPPNSERDYRVGVADTGVNRIEVKWKSGDKEMSRKFTLTQ